MCWWGGSAWQGKLQIQMGKKTGGGWEMNCSKDDEINSVSFQHPSVLKSPQATFLLSSFHFVFELDLENLETVAVI